MNDNSTEEKSTKSADKAILYWIVSASLSFLLVMIMMCILIYLVTPKQENKINQYSIQHENVI